MEKTVLVSRAMPKARHAKQPGVRIGQSNYLYLFGDLTGNINIWDWSHSPTRYRSSFVKVYFRFTASHGY